MTSGSGWYGESVPVLAGDASDSTNVGRAVSRHRKPDTLIMIKVSANELDSLQVPGGIIVHSNCCSADG